MMDALSEAKASARQAAFAARKQVHGTGLDVPANAHLKDLLAQMPDARVVSGFLPIRTEISPLETMSALVAEGRDVCVPVILGKSMPLAFHRWTPDMDLVEGPFGARVPRAAEPLQPDVLITPLLTWDRQGYRLGYGGGFYDRTLELLNTARRAVSIGFAYAAQEVAQVPREPTDWKLDAIVTEKGVHRP